MTHNQCYKKIVFFFNCPQLLVYVILCVNLTTFLLFSSQCWSFSDVTSWRRMNRAQIGLFMKVFALQNVKYWLFYCLVPWLRGRHGKILIYRNGFLQGTSYSLIWGTVEDLFILSGVDQGKGVYSVRSIPWRSSLSNLMYTMEERYMESGADDGRAMSQILRKWWKNGMGAKLDL